MDEKNTERRVGYTEVHGKLAEHDHHIDTLSHAIEVLSETTGATNNKLDSLISAISTQNVLVEKVHNMDNNLSDSFKRRDRRLDILEDTQNGNGCGALRQQKAVLAGMAKTIESNTVLMHEHKVDHDTRLKVIEGKVSEAVGATVVRWAVGVIVTLLILVATMGAARDANTYNDMHTSILTNSKSVSALKVLAAEKIYMQREINKNTEVTLQRLGSSMDMLNRHHLVK